MREAAITHELTDEIMKKKQLIEHLRNREQELEETLAAVRDGANAAKHQITVLLKEKVPIRKSHNCTSSLIRACFFFVVEEIPRGSIGNANALGG